MKYGTFPLTMSHIINTSLRRLLFEEIQHVHNVCIYSGTKETVVLRKEDAHGIPSHSMLLVVERTLR